MSVFGVPIFPEQASSFAMDVDALYFFIVAVSAFFALLVAVLVVIFGIKYHRKRANEVGARIEGNLPMELLWSVIPTVIAMVMFGWGASVFYHLRRPPAEAMHIYAVGKQWMWKFQHLEGQREINELHVPMGRPIKVTVTSEDVIHSLYFPAFRTKIDAIPGRYQELWFEATKPGTYHIFCAEYCGTNHSGMIGSVHVLEPARIKAGWPAAPKARSPIEGARSSTSWRATPATSTPGRAADRRSTTSGARPWSCRMGRRWWSMKPTCASRF
jgi:cytochrome c oxidase subunit II